jgi:hypothetical protein
VLTDGDVEDSCNIAAFAPLLCRMTGDDSAAILGDCDIDPIEFGGWECVMGDRDPNAEFTGEYIADGLFVTVG